jgi:ABC-type sugar transport system ATPase subunit
VTLAIRPVHVQIAAASSDGVANTIGKVTSKNYLGDAALLEVEVNGVLLLAKIAGDTKLCAGQQANVDLPAQRWQYLASALM